LTAIIPRVARIKRHIIAYSITTNSANTVDKQPDVLQQVVDNRLTCHLHTTIYKNHSGLQQDVNIVTETMLDIYILPPTSKSAELTDVDNDVIPE